MIFYKQSMIVVANLEETKKKNHTEFYLSEVSFGSHSARCVYIHLFIQHIFIEPLCQGIAWKNKQTTAKKRQTKIYAVNEHSYVPPQKNDTLFFILFLTSFFYMLVFLKHSSNFVRLF